MSWGLGPTPEWIQQQQQVKQPNRTSSRSWAISTWRKTWVFWSEQCAFLWGSTPSTGKTTPPRSTPGSRWRKGISSRIPPSRLRRPSSRPVWRSWSCRIRRTGGLWNARLLWICFRASGLGNGPQRTRIWADRKPTWQQFWRVSSRAQKSQRL